MIIFTFFSNPPLYDYFYIFLQSPTPQKINKGENKEEKKRGKSMLL